MSSACTAAAPSPIHPFTKRRIRTAACRAQSLVIYGSCSSTQLRCPVHGACSPRHTAGAPICCQLSLAPDVHIPHASLLHNDPTTPRQLIDTCRLVMEYSIHHSYAIHYLQNNSTACGQHGSSTARHLHDDRLRYID